MEKQIIFSIKKGLINRDFLKSSIEKIFDIKKKTLESILKSKNIEKNALIAWINEILSSNDQKRSGSELTYRLLDININNYSSYGNYKLLDYSYEEEKILDSYNRLKIYDFIISEDFTKSLNNESIIVGSHFTTNIDINEDFEIINVFKIKDKVSLVGNLKNKGILQIYLKC